MCGVLRSAQKGHVISSAVEHAAVLETLRRFEQQGFEVTYLKPIGFGAITPKQS